METIQHLISHAVGLAGGNLCLAGHQWEGVGGRACPNGNMTCTQTVFRCRCCGEWDYGEEGGPGYLQCHLSKCDINFL